MASQRFERKIQNICNMDKPISSSQSGLMRWQTKRTNTTDPLMDLSVNAHAKNTPGKSSSPTKTKTPSYSDRFIPVYSNKKYDAANYMYKFNEEASKSNNDDSIEAITEKNNQHQRNMTENLNNEKSDDKVLHMNNAADKLPVNTSNVKTLFSTGPSISTVKTTRYISSKPERILDAPDFINDYYLNLLDWSSTNLMAVALNRIIYIWSLETGNINELLEMDSANSKDYVCSIAFTEDGDHIAVGTTMNTIQIWDVATQKKMRTMRGHIDRVSSMCWKNHILTSGSRNGEIHHYDVRYERYHISSLLSHKLEVCGLKWSSDGKYLASGGNDNILNIWSVSTTEPEIMGEVFTVPLFHITRHTAAIKALAFCPWQPSLLASGGGSLDKHIHFWNCATGECVKSVNTESQVCALMWSTNYRELISSHGYEDYQLSIWTYPQMERIKDLRGHRSRAVHLAMSPDGDYVASMSGDETLCLWKCFEKDKTAPKKNPKSVRRITNKENAITKKSHITGFNNMRY